MASARRRFRFALQSRHATFARVRSLNRRCQLHLIAHQNEVVGTAASSNSIAQAKLFGFIDQKNSQIVPEALPGSTPTPFRRPRNHCLVGERLGKYAESFGQTTP